MGIKIKSWKIYCLILLIALATGSFSHANAGFIYSIPENTLQIANTTHIEQLRNAPKSEFIRVGISDSAFKNYTYTEISVYGTGDLFIYEDGALLGRYPDNKVVKIKITDGQIILYPSEHEMPSQINGKLELQCPDGLLGVHGLTRAGKPALYRGSFEIVRVNGAFNIVNVIEVEEYLRGVVPNEMPVKFGLEALKAQSVAARNYVLSPRTKASPNYDVVDSVASQVYFGANTEKTLSDQAVEQTEGVVALYDWNLILAQYSSTAGGYTESFANVFSDPVSKKFPSEHKPYLVAKPDILSRTPLNTDEAASEFYKSKPDSYDIRSPYFRWERDWTAKELKDALEKTLPAQSATGFVKPAFNSGQKLSDIEEIKVIKRGESGKIIELEIITKNQTYKVYKELVIRRLITKNGTALPSANVVFENIKDDKGNLISIKAYGGGYGHGVGMSQYGAGFMGSELNLTYDKILKHYYTGVSLATKPVIISSDVTQSAVQQSFYTKDKNVSIIVDNKYQASKLIANINGKEYCFDLPTGFLSGKRIAKIDISQYIKSGRNTIMFIYPTDEGSKKALRLYMELVKDDNNSIW